MRTIFHVGQSKTGTTTLQQTFKASRKALAQRGILYPANPNKRYNNHKLLFADLLGEDRTPRHISNRYAPDALPAARDELVRGVRREIEAQRPDCLVLSSETRFGSFGSTLRRGFLDTLAEIGAVDTEIVAYIRRPSSWYLSSLQQRLRSSHEFKQPNLGRAARVVRQFCKDFGEPRVHVRAFDRRALAHGDLVADFVEGFLAPHGLRVDDLERRRDTNTSFSAEGSDLTRRYRLAFHADKPDRYVPDGWAFLAALAEVEAGMEPRRPSLQPGLAEAIDYCYDDLLKLRDRHGLVLPDYDYERLERGDLTTLPEETLPLERIVRIDRAAQRAVVERLRGSDWARGSEAKERWLDALEVELGTLLARSPAQVAALGPMARQEPHAAGPAVDAGLGELWRPEPLGPGAAVTALDGTLARAMAPALREHGLLWLDGSAPVGDVPTATLLAAWTGWALGAVPLPEAFEQREGRWFDPLRPDAAPEGFASPEAALADRRAAAEALGRTLRETSALLVELRAAEAFHDAASGLEVPRAEHGRGEVQGFAEVAAALREAVRLMHAENPHLRVILAVSPEWPMDAGAGLGALLAATEARAVLRAAVGEVARTVPGVDYFPALELVAGPQAHGAFEPDGCRLRAEGAAHLARCLAAALSRGTGAEAPAEGELAQI